MQVYQNVIKADNTFNKASFAPIVSCSLSNDSLKGNSAAKSNRKLKILN